MVALGLFPISVPAASDSPPLPKHDPKRHWRVITHDDATTASTCIGSQETPLYVAESFLAAKLRGDHDLYLRSRGWDKDDLDWLTPKRAGQWVKYRIQSAGRFKPGDKRKDDRGDNLGWVSGDVWIVMDIRNCDEAKCSKPTPIVVHGRAVATGFPGFHCPA